MSKVFFLVNRIEEFAFETELKKYLPSVTVTVGESLPQCPEEYELVVLWSYRKVIPSLSRNQNIIVFHSTNLPAGKGWAPVYHTILEGNTHFTITGLLASDQVDAGDIVVKARFAIHGSYTAPFLRQWDHEISLLLVQKILARFQGRPIQGTPQTGDSTYHTRRRPNDNEIDVEIPFVELIPHLRACEPKHPAFFFHEGVKYKLTIEPASHPKFPEDLEIVFYDSPQ